ncbi:MAG: hypothetical protein OIN85_06340 [Candidatus Methanoperedens sp.]|nr:hypothetical protein [Candidatus Methanoperedens sp.]
MTTRKILVFFLILMLTASPVLAGDVTLNRWVLNVTLHDDGLVEEVIQAEIDNGGSLPLGGFSFIVPASAVTMIYDFSHTQSFTGMVVDQQSVPGGVKVTVNFNSSIETGKNWDGRIGFTAQNWAVKEGSDYSIIIPVKAPQAIVAGKETEISVPLDSEIRSQVFLPKGVTATSVDVKSSASKPYKKLLQFEYVVLTWFQLNNGDIVSIKGSFSEVLMKIVDNDAKYRELSTRIKNAKEQGLNVSDAQTHLNNAEDYNNNQALQSFWKGDTTVALQYAAYANDELKLAENSLSSPEKTTLPAETAQGAQSQKSPGFEIAGLILILLISRTVQRKK